MRRVRVLWIVVAVACVNVPRARAQTITYARDIAPLLNAHCVSCHRPGAVGPFALQSYREVRQHLGQVRDATARRVMPPWKPRPGPHPFVDDRSLSTDDLRRLQDWIANGAPEGNAADLPPAPAFGSGWQLGTPDLVVQMSAPYTLRADGGDVFRTFVLPIKTDRPRYVRGVEFQPGNARAVHHANMGVDRTQSSRRLDAADVEPGYVGGMVPDADYPPGYMLGWTPGQTPRPSPDGMPWRLDPGSDFIVQLHMQPTGKPEVVQVSLALYFTDTPPTATPVGVRLGSQLIDIPAGQALYEITDRFTVPVDVDLLAVQPHAHNLGRTIRGDAQWPDGTTSTLLAIDDWDFRWQDVYRYTRPVRLPQGTVVTMRVTYDNSSANARNPSSPPQHVVWGQNTSDEMGDLWLQLVAVRAADLPRLATEVRRKSLSDDIAAYTKVLRADPRNPLRYDAVAMLQLQAGRIETAVALFRESLRLNPDSAPTQYNLGLAFSMLRRYPEATAQFEAALKVDPDHAEAHNNLGAMLHAAGRVDEAALHYRRAVELRPDNADAHANLGRLLSGQRDWARSIEAFRRAIAVRPDHPSALAGLALVLSASPLEATRNPAEAQTLAQRAVDLTGHRDPVSLDALAAAQAASGSFSAASSTIDEAMRVADALGLQTYWIDLRERQRLYRIGTAYVLP